MKKEKIESEIKQLNSIRSIYNKNFKEIEKRYNNKEISDKTFDKHKRKYMSRIEKVKEKIRKLEEELR
jgi:chaperonin cofactor prefoldin